MIDTIAAIVFIVLLTFFLFKKRKQLTVQKALFPIVYVLMYRTSFGIKTMDKIAKRWPRLVALFGDVSIVLGFLGMIAIGVQLVYSTFQLFTGSTTAAIQPVLPIEVNGVFFVPFSYWIISIFLLALVHEFAHGILARAHNIPVHSSGFAFLCLLVPVIPAAFVEPDEKVVVKKTRRQQWAMMAAGPVSNFAFALIIFVIMMGFAPLMDKAYDTTGIELATVTEHGPAHAAGLQSGMIVTAINGEQLTSAENVTSYFTAPNQTINVTTKNESFLVTLAEHPDNHTKPYLGITARPHLEATEEFVSTYGSWTPEIIKWTGGLLFWLIMLNIGIGLFNLLPLGPLDGGRMFLLVCQKFFGKHANRIWGTVSLVFLVLILANIAKGFIP